MFIRNCDSARCRIAHDEQHLHVRQHRQQLGDTGFADGAVRGRDVSAQPGARAGAVKTPFVPLRREE
jgi:hypothetical protein